MKRQKVKRYNGGYVEYQNRRKAKISAIKIIVLILFLALLIFLFFNIKDRVIIRLEEMRQEALLEKQNSVVTETQIEEKKVEETPIEKQSPEIKKTVETPTDVQTVTLDNSSLKAYCINSKFGSNLDELSNIISNIDPTTCNTIVVTAKDSYGRVYFNSTNVLANASTAVVENPYNASQVVNILHTNNLKAYASLDAFSDGILSLDRSLCVTYNNTESRWLDNSLNLNGKSWLDPTNKTSRQYIKDLALELANAGFDGIILNSVQFPDGFSLEKATYSKKGNFDRQNELKTFISEITSELEGAGVKVYLSVHSDFLESYSRDSFDSIYLNDCLPLIFGGNPKDLLGDNKVLILDNNSVDLTKYEGFNYFIKYEEDNTSKEAISSYLSSSNINSNYILILGGKI